jgi:hypothetical protein
MKHTKLFTSHGYESSSIIAWPQPYRFAAALIWKLQRAAEYYKSELPIDF